MAKLIVLAEAEQDLINLLNMLPTESLSSILTKLADQLPEEQKQFYMAEIGTWGALGKKNVLINDIVDIITEYMPPEVLMEEVDEITETAFPMNADKPGGRYFPQQQEQDYWSPDLQAPRSPYQNLTRAPGIPEVKPEVERIMPHPEQQYKDPELMETGYRVGPPPPIPEEIPNFAAMDQASQAGYSKGMQKQLLAALQQVPRPYIMEMVYQYLAANHEDEAEQYNIDGVASRSRFGFNKQHLISRMTKSMPIDDLFYYWNSIVNHKLLPWVNTEWVDKRFGGGALGQNIGTMYNAWQEGADLSHIQMEWPETTTWQEPGDQPEWWPHPQTPVNPNG